MPPKKKEQPAAEETDGGHVLAPRLAPRRRAGAARRARCARRCTASRARSTRTRCAICLTCRGSRLRAICRPMAARMGSTRTATRSISRTSIWPSTSRRRRRRSISPSPRGRRRRRCRSAASRSPMPAGFVAHVIMNGDGVLLKDKKPDPEFPPAADETHLDMGAHERMGSFDADGATRRAVPARGRIDEPVFHGSRHDLSGAATGCGLRSGASSGTRARCSRRAAPRRARLSVVQLTGDGRGGQHPSYVLGYYDAPSIESKEHEVVTWMNVNEIIGFNTASLAPAANYARKGHAMSFTGPGIACDWLDVEGPLHDQWPPKSHELLFGKLPLAEFKKAEHPGRAAAGAREDPPDRRRQEPARSRAGPLDGAERAAAWTTPTGCSRAFCPRRSGIRSMQRRVRRYLSPKSKSGWTRATASRRRCATRIARRFARRSFLYHIETPGPLDDFALRLAALVFLLELDARRAPARARRRRHAAPARGAAMARSSGCSRTRSRSASSRTSSASG